MTILATPRALSARAPFHLTVCGLLALTAAGPAAAEGQPPDPALLIELNKAEQLEDTCRLVFMTRNELGANLDELSFETVLFDTQGTVERFTLFDFRDVPAGKTRVRQFDLPDARCASIGRVLINGTAACKGEGIADGDCASRLDPSTRIDMELSG